MYVGSRAANVQTNVVLTCMATGFSSVNTVLQIKRDGRVLTRADGVQCSGVRPNGDGTFQQRDQVEVPKNDESKYTCEVTHGSSGLHVVKVWGKKLTPRRPVCVRRQSLLGVHRVRGDMETRPSW